MVRPTLLLSCVLSAKAQHAGTLKENYLMPMPLAECTESGCESGSASLTLDANWRWTHSASGSQNCYTGDSWDSALCPDGEACAENCALGGTPLADWSGTLGVKQTTDGVDLGFVTVGPYSKNVGSRLYLMEGTEYKMFNMLNKEIAFDVDMSNMPCGLNGAVYFVEMDKTGNMGGTNKAGAAYGTGYCDGQCARDVKFVKGEANIKDWKVNTQDPWSNSGTGSYGSCCAEMDLWEANSMSTVFTAHPSSKEGLVICNGDSECGSQQGDRYIAPTDRDGCDINSYRMGETTFYGPGSSFSVDTTKPFTVVTQFHAPDGVLERISQSYIQDGKRIEHPKYMGTDNAETGEFCAAQKASFGDTDDFTKKGGLEAMGEALDRGMVLVVSEWDDINVYMNWLDSYDPEQDPSTPGIKRGPCSPLDGKPETLRVKHPDSHYSFGNLRWGDIGSTQHPITPGPTPVPTPTPETTPGPTPTPGSGKCCWSGCGGCAAGGGWCDASEDNCVGNCGGTWCPSDMTTFI